ncbi:O-antigen/teichoic acid export membrane protein [Chryseobacterium ginsenosidimutans]|uniref:MOP flippase family protein n=1 Tax=Chryseobacterium ginsenosidimutans TaxID=687846 RepID=UPI002781CDF7|nr:MOP flippase family protein [Chryseobacterium ginsenosidimutans]MDQ0595113.1 O-antigen/teichoic acid export membrane protein [Chryseobacterium ginsenosidimutans]
MKLNFKTNNGLLGGTIWTTISFIVVSIIYLLRISILTRYLNKSDFGLVAIVLFVLGFTNIFAELGISTSLLSQKHITKREYSSLYWGGSILAIILYLLISLSSPLFANFYEHDELNTLIPIMGLDIIISSVGRQFSVFKQKEFKFRELAIIKILSETTSLFVAIILALNGYGIWSLILSLLTSSFINSILNFILGYKSHPLIFCLNIKETKHLYKIGFYHTGAQILDYIASQIDVLILGKILPMSEMGVYSIVKTLVLRIYSSVNQIVTKVTVPYFAKIKPETSEFKNKYLIIIQLISIINILIYSIIIACDKEVLYIFYGKDYIIYNNLLSILCIWGIFSSIINCASVILVISTGRTDLGFKWTQFRLILNPLFILIGGYFWGMKGIAISQALYSIFTLFFYREIVIKVIIQNIRSIDLINSIKYPIILCTILVVLMHSFVNVFIDSIILNKYLSLVFKSLIISSIFLVLMFKKIKESVNSLKN